jgi:hypothetical protein
MPTTIDSAGITFNDATSFTSAVLAANSVGATQIANGSVTASKLGTTEQKQICKAWVNFNGTLATPITPRASYNVSSVTKNGTGDYTVNFSTAMTDANYVLAGTNSYILSTTGSSGAILAPYIKLTSSIQIRTNVVNTAQDSQMVDVAIFGN